MNTEKRRTLGPIFSCIASLLVFLSLLGCKAGSTSTEGMKAASLPAEKGQELVKDRLGAREGSLRKAALAKFDAGNGSYIAYSPPDLNVENLMMRAMSGSDPQAQTQIANAKQSAQKQLAELIVKHLLENPEAVVIVPGYVGDNLATDVDLQALKCKAMVLDKRECYYVLLAGDSLEAVQAAQANFNSDAPVFLSTLPSTQLASWKEKSDLSADDVSALTAGLKQILVNDKSGTTVVAWSGP